MKLYLIQHGKAKSKDEDPDRHLSSEGIEEVHRISSFLKKNIIKVDCIYHSGKPRAAETANILKKGVYSINDVMGMDGLNPNDDVMNIAQFILDNNKDIMIVGHLPFLTKIISLLIYNDESITSVSFQKGSVLCLEYDKNMKIFKILWFVVPDIIK